MERVRIIILLWVLTTPFLACGSERDTLPAPVSPETRVLKINPEQELQTIDGFGASDAWRCQMVGKYWPDEKKNAIADLLFSKEIDEKGNPKGIGLSIWRFYLGAGSMEQGADSDISNEWRRGECFQSPDGTYDWNKQEGQRWFLRAARERGVEKYLAFTISPPVHMTINGKAFSPQKQRMNIETGRMPEYADFLVDCIENLQNKEEVTFDYLSPVNEPQWDWMAGSNGKAGQEGTPAINRELFEFTSLLSERLNERNLSTTIALGEAGAINYLYGRVNNEMRDNQVEEFWDPASSLYIGSLPNVENVITGHSYFSVWPISSQVEHRQKLNDQVKKHPGLKYWQTEYCILEQPGEHEIPGGTGNQRDLGMKTALFVARIIHNDLVVANASSWQWWTALTRADYKDGLVYLDDGVSNGSQSSEYCKKDGFFRDSKLLWAFGNYARFIRPGMKRIHVGEQNPVQASADVMISAYKNAATKKLVIVAVNVSNSERTYKLEMNGKLKHGKLIPYTTSALLNLARGTEVLPDKIVIAPKSVITLTGEME